MHGYLNINWFFQYIEYIVWGLFGSTNNFFTHFNVKLSRYFSSNMKKDKFQLP